MAVKTFYVKSTIAGGGALSFCSGRSTSSLGSGVSPDRAASETSTDLAANSQSVGSSDTNVVISYGECLPAVAAWASGNYDVTIEVTVANMNLTLNEIHLCRVNTSNGAVATIGSLTGIARNLGSTGSVTHTVSGSADTHSSSDKLEVVMIATNGAMSNQSVTWKITIATPIDGGAAAFVSDDDFILPLPSRDDSSVLILLS